MIVGQRLRLRSVEKADLPQFTEWLNDAEVIEGLAHYQPLSSVDEEHWFENTFQRPPEERPLAIEVREGEAWRLIGNAGLFNIHWPNRNAEFGIFIGDKSNWDKGYGTETLALILGHGFNTLNLHRIYLRVHANNIRARRSYEKAGLVLEGNMRQAAFRNGQYVDVLIMGILQPEWKGSVEG